MRLSSCFGEHSTLASMPVRWTERSPSEWTSGMRAIREKEIKHGLPVEARVFMRRELERHPLGSRLQVRVARQTGRLDEIVTFYREGLGLQIASGFV